MKTVNHQCGLAAARRGRRGFTLVELLVVIGIIGILAAILLPAITTSFQRAEITRAATEVRAIDSALRAYLSEYGRWLISSGTGDSVYNNGNRDVMRTLMAINQAPNSNNQLNPRRIPFLEVGADQLDNSDNFIDPWGLPYRIILDTNYDNRCVGAGLTVENRSSIVWSAGPDRQDNTDDDIRSWRD